MGWGSARVPAVESRRAQRDRIDGAKAKATSSRRSSLAQRVGGAIGREALRMSLAQIV